MTEKPHKKKLNLTDSQDTIDDRQFQNPDKTHFRIKFPKFADKCHETNEGAEWLVCEALSDYYLERFRVVGSNQLRSGKFFQQSWTHQAMFYRLMKKFAAATRSKDDAVGVSKTELLAYMKRAQNLSASSIETIISTALKEGFIETVRWHKDKRITLYYLSPESVVDFMAQGMENAYDASMASGLPMYLLMLEKFRSEDEKNQTVGEILREFLLKSKGKINQ